MSKKPEPDPSPKLDERHMQMRASVLRLRQYVHARMLDTHSQINATEIYARLTAALYPKNDFRDEPLQKLLDKARKDEAQDFRQQLEAESESIKSLASVCQKGKLKCALEEIVAQNQDFLKAVDGGEVPPDEEEPGQRSTD